MDDRIAEALIEQYVMIHGEGDVDALLALHTEDAEFVIPGELPVRGAAALRDLFCWDEVLESKLTMEGIRVEGEAVIIEKVVERNKWFEGLGLAEVRFRPGTRLMVRDGLISGTYVTGFEEVSHSQFVDGFGRLVGWLSKQRPEMMDRLLPDGRFRYDEARARLWLQVMAAWHRSEAQPGDRAGA